MPRLCWRFWRPCPARRPGHERRHVHVLRDPYAVADQGAGPAVRGLRVGLGARAGRPRGGRPHQGSAAGGRVMRAPTVTELQAATAATEAAIEDGDLVGIYLAAEAEEAAYAQ